MPTIVEELKDAWIPTIYREKVRTQRTRAYEMDVPARENVAEIFFTLLGIELKVAKKRFSCPDLATARYLQVFARLGCGSVAIPYDITKISVLADEFEVAWQKLMLTFEFSASKTSPQARGRQRSALVRMVRTEVTEIGPGEKMPDFKNSTRQRNS